MSHGLSYTPEYRAWQQMVRRCHNPEHPAYANYGGRGILVCDEWREDVTAFVADMGERPSPAHELDRIDNDRGYFPGNVRWTDRVTNSRNRRSNRVLEIDGFSQPVTAWAEEYGVKRNTISKRLAAGWPPEQAVKTPARAKQPNGEAKPTTHDCADCGCPGVTGTLCKSCENKRRWREGMYR